MEAEAFKSLKDEYIKLVNAVLEKPAKENSNLISLDDQWVFAFQFRNMKDFVNRYLIPSKALAAGEFEQKESIPLLSANERTKIFDKEKYERDMILKDLIFSTHINMSKFLESENSRRFIATNDSCLSFAQVTLDDNFYRWVFVSRSTEVNQMLPSDFYSIGKIILEWTQWFYEYTNFNCEKTRGIKIFFILNNPHIYL